MNCDIALVYHASEQRLRCHYCDFQIAPPDRCSKCGAPDAALLGVGTQRLEEEVRGQFPKACIARLDRDTAKRRGFTESVLRGLRDRSIDIVVGTQMVAKGHDFPGVRLVGVVVAVDVPVRVAEVVTVVVVVAVVVAVVVSVDVPVVVREDVPVVVTVVVAVVVLLEVAELVTVEVAVVLTVVVRVVLGELVTEVVGVVISQLANVPSA